LLPAKDRADARVAENLEPLGAPVVGCVVDDDDLDDDLLLCESTGQGVSREQVPAIARRDDDRDVG